MADSNETESDIQIEPFFGGFILETLTLGMYEESRNAIREYLQNSFDAIQKAVHENLLTHDQGKVTVKVGATCVSILDNGVGIPQELAVETLTSIGASKKRYQDQAGFRGIGRLAGIAFADTVRFRTKARGEAKETIVTFDGRALRRDMSPSNLSPISLTDLLNKHVKAQATSGHAKDAHYFEVLLDGFTSAAPLECTDPNAMQRFVSQIAPVAYRTDFPLRPSIYAEAKQRKRAIEEVNVFVGDSESQTQVFKPYGKTFAIGSRLVDITELRAYGDEHWWAWVGVSKEPGAIKNEESRGLRIRVRNIQIDGTQITSSIFANLKQKASYTRFNEWYVGEIFIDPAFLIPNARRDAFEDDGNWLAVRSQLAGMCEALGKQAYETSKKLQQSVGTLTEEVRRIEAESKSLTSKKDPDPDALIKLSSTATKVHRLISRAMRTEEPQELAQLRSLENRAIDVKAAAVKRLGIVSKYDLDELQEEARNELLEELIALLKEHLDPKAFAKVARIIDEHFVRS